MSEERRTTHERLIRAFGSSDLSLVPGERKDADHLIALGLAERMAGSVAEVVKLHLVSTQSEYRRARDAVVKLAGTLNERRNWRLSRGNVRRVGELALAHHAFPVCQECHGRGYEVEEGAPMLSGRICKACGGTGVRPVQKKFRDQIRDVIEVIERVGWVTERAVERLLR